VWLFPTLGVLYEELLKDDTEAVVALMTGFNRWLLEDWGFAFRDTIYASPYLSLADVDMAVRELEWCLENGARTMGKILLGHSPTSCSTAPNHIPLQTASDENDRLLTMQPRASPRRSSPASRLLGVFLHHTVTEQPAKILDPLAVIPERCAFVHAILVREDVALDFPGIN